MSLLEAIRTLRAALRNDSSQNGELTGELRLTSELIDCLSILEGDARLLRVSDLSGNRVNSDAVTIGQSYNVQVRVSGTGFYETADDLIREYPESAPPTTFEVWLPPDGFLDGYKDTIGFIQLLGTAADHREKATGKFLFITTRKFEIRPSYTSDDVRVLPKLSDLRAAMEGTDCQTKLALFKTAVVETLRDVTPNLRFRHLLRNFEPLYANFTHAYVLYLQQFSYEKVHKAYEEKKLKYISDLNGIVAGIQTGIIGVPLAYFLIAEKLSPSQFFTLKNIILTAGGVLFCIVILLVAFNQRKTLKSIQTSIKEAEGELDSVFPEHFKKTKSMLQDAKRHSESVGALLTFVQVIVCVSAFMLSAVLIYVSVPKVQSFIQWEAAKTDPASQP